jgi:hypothetical protein
MPINKRDRPLITRLRTTNDLVKPNRPTPTDSGSHGGSWRTSPPSMISHVLTLGIKILLVGVDIWWISDPTSGGAIFHPRVRPTPTPWIGRSGRGFHFSPIGDLWISKILYFDGFSPANPPKFPSVSKFWSIPIISLTQVLYRTSRWHSSYSPTQFFPWCSNPPQSHNRIHLHFAQTRGWSKTWPKPNRCGCGCDFSPAGVAAGGYRRCGCGQVFIKLTLNPPHCHP